MSATSPNYTPEYLSARVVGQRVGYSPDYITRLAREKKIAARKENNQWLVDPDSVKFFLLQIEADKRQRKEQIREERIRERARFQKTSLEERVIKQSSRMARHAIAQTGVVAVCLFILGSLFWFSFEANLNADIFTDGFEMVVDKLVAVIVEPIPQFMSQVAAFAFVASPNEVADFQENDQRNAVKSNTPSSSVQGDFSGIVVFEETADAPERVAEMRESFSDEVRVEFAGDDTGVIVPVFKEREGEAYRFLLVPVANEGE